VTRSFSPKLVAPVSPARRHVLPDVLEQGLRFVFCGTAAGAVAARVGVPYAGPGNRFWWVLHETGLTPRELRADEFRELPRYGIGLTDVAKYTSGSDSSLTRSDFDPAAVVAKVERYAPAVLAFVGKRAGQEVLGRPVGYGPQGMRIGVSDVWVVPSTSGAARGAWSLEPWRALSAEVVRQEVGRELCHFTSTPRTPGAKVR
jgi:double-stranded uracil-DNA glycosylase